MDEVRTTESERMTFSIHDMPREKVELLKRTICKGGSDDEVELFLHVCNRMQLDPFARQIYAVKRRTWDSKKKEYIETMTTQVGIDGFRLQAQRTGEYEGQLGPYWCGEDGDWKEVWLKATPPRAAKVGVLRKGFREPIWSIALWDSYVQTDRDGKPTKFWGQMGPLMIGKVAEALGLRRAFPAELSGVYIPEEMDQADREAAPGPRGKELAAGPKVVEAEVIEPPEPELAPAPVSDEHRAAFQSVQDREQFCFEVMGFGDKWEARKKTLESVFNTATRSGVTAIEACLEGLAKGATDVENRAFPKLSEIATTNWKTIQNLWKKAGLVKSDIHGRNKQAKLLRTIPETEVPGTFSYARALVTMQAEELMRLATLSGEAARLEAEHDTEAEA